MFTRRNFLESCAAAAGCLACDGCANLCGARAGSFRVPYGETIGDRLWMWGHHALSLMPEKGKPVYNIPPRRHVEMAEACRLMGIPGCFVVRWRNLPVKADLPEYMKQFAATRRVGFSITDGSAEEFDEKVSLALEFADKMPNLTSVVMDDYWTGGIKQQSIGHLREAKQRFSARGVRLGVVLYADTNGVKPAYRDVLDLCDEVTFWFWNGKSVAGIESQVASLRQLVGPEKPVLLGQYMWDFGGAKPLSGALMETQLASASRLLAQRQIHGVIFHCTPLVDMDIDAVRVSKAWIRENAARKWGSA